MPDPTDTSELGAEETEALLALALQVGQSGFLDQACAFATARFGVRVALVGEVTDWSLRRSRVLAMQMDGKAAVPFEYDLADTPCEEVYLRRACAYPERVQQQFPRDRWLAENQIESYVGVPLTNEAGVPIGHLALLDSQPRPATLLDSMLLRVLVTLVRAELAWRQGERERLTLQRKLLEQQRIDSLGTLTSGTAHDFNNLMTVLLGHAESAQEFANGTPGLEAAMRAIDQAARRAAELARSMLQHVAPHAASAKPESLSALVEELEPLARSCVPAGRHLGFALAGNLPSVFADATQMRQLVLNLILNAGEAIADRGGGVQVTTGSTQLTEQELTAARFGRERRPGPYVYVEVRDDGPGIAPELLARIFDPFFSTKAHGRGMGLAAVESILRAHGGVLQLWSSPAGGARFRVLLPPVESQPASGTTRTDALHGRRILVVDDEPTVLRAIARSLRSLGCEARTMATGAECLLALHRGLVVDAVLLDLGLSDMPGLAVYRELRARHPGLAVILMSGFDDSGQLDADDADARSGFLAKPFSVDQLQAALGNLIGRP